MCPFCLTAAAIIAGSASGTGGLAALVACVVLKKKQRELFIPIREQEVRNGDSNNTRETA